MSVDPEQGLAFAEEGPNALIAYWGSGPLDYEAEIHVNRQALQRGSVFWRAQRERRPAFSAVELCTRADVEPYIAVILAHEGIGLNERSHAGLYHGWMEENAGPVVEGITAEAVQGLVDATAEALQPMLQDAEEESDRADTEFAPQYCRFNFDYAAPPPIE